MTTREVTLDCIKATRYTALAPMIKVQDIIKVTFLDVDMLLAASLMIPFWDQTLPLTFICVMGNVPMNYNLCLDFFFHLTRTLSPTLYWWLFRHKFSRFLILLIRNCLRCRMCSQSATR